MCSLFPKGFSSWVRCTSIVVLSTLVFNYLPTLIYLEEAEAGIRLPGEISITSDMQMTPPLWQKVKRN